MVSLQFKFNFNCIEKIFNCHHPIFSAWLIGAFPGWLE